MNEYKNRMDTMYGKAQRPWGVEPLPVFPDFITELKPGTVLDLGVGDGRNALYLAEKGFDITGVDLSEMAIEKLITFANLLENIKMATAINGINIISDFTQTGPMYRSDMENRWLKDGELKEIYKDWEILHFKEEERIARQKDFLGNNYIQMGTEIVARKLPQG